MSTVSHQLLAQLCADVYDREDESVWSVFETDVLVRREDGYLILCLRGTEFGSIKPDSWHWRDIKKALSNVLDVARDFRFFPMRNSITGFWGHQGFIRGPQRWLNKYADQLDPALPIVLSGHSLGAAEAFRLAAMLKAKGFTVAEVVVFGEPSGFYFGSEKKYQKLRIPSTSYLNSNDWIQWAGFGSTAVKPTVMFPGEPSKRKSHDIELYADALAGKTVGNV